MRIIYTKRHKFKFLGLKLFELVTDYNERSTEKDSNDNEFYIELKEVENEKRD
jgi:hypothetical protein